MVRPTGTKKIKKLDYLYVKLEHDHKLLIEQEAIKQGMSLSSFIRSTLLKASQGAK